MLQISNFLQVLLFVFFLGFLQVVVLVLQEDLVLVVVHLYLIFLVDGIVKLLF